MSEKFSIGKLLTLAVIAICIIGIGFYFFSHTSNDLVELSNSKQEIIAGDTIEDSVSEKMSGVSKKVIAIQNIKKLKNNFQKISKNGATDEEIKAARLKIIENIMVATGTNESFDNIVKTMIQSFKMSVEKGLGNLGDEFYTGLEDKLNEVTNEFMPLEKIQAMLEKEFSTDELVELSDFYDDPAIQRSVELQEEYTKPEKIKELQEFFTGEKKVEISEDRKKLFDDIIVNGKVVEKMAEMSKIAQETVLKTMFSEMPADKLKQVEAQIKAQQNNVVVHLKSIFPMLLAHQYRDFENRDLKTLSLFSGHPASVKLGDKTTEVTMPYMKAVMSAIVNETKNIVDKK